MKLCAFYQKRAVFVKAALWHAICTSPQGGHFLISGVAAGQPGAAVADIAAAAGVAAAGSTGNAAAAVAATGSTANIAAGAATAVGALTRRSVIAARIAAGIGNKIGERDTLHTAAGVAGIAGIAGITGIACHKRFLQKKNVAEVSFHDILCQIFKMCHCR